MFMAVRSRASRTERSAHPRSGFTLVEILVVVAIITILVALLVPAVMFAVSRAKRGRMAMEVASISKALERYKLEYGEYPPDFADVQLYPSADARAARAVEIITEHLQSIRRRRDTVFDLPMANQSTRDVAVLSQLNPSNALYFWLGGLASNPEYPLMGQGERTVMLDFAKERITNVLQARIVEGKNQNGAVLSNQVRDVAGQYYPAGDATKRPFIYYRADSYTTNSADPSQTAAVRWVKAIFDNAVSVPGLGQQNLPPVPYLENLNGKTNFAASDKFQVICAGLDGIYGTIQPVNGQLQWDNLTTYPTIPTGIAVSKDHRDNVTSFTEGAIEDRLSE